MTMMTADVADGLLKVHDLADELDEAGAVLLQLGQAEGPDTAEGKAVAYMSSRICETADRLRSIVEGLRQTALTTALDKE